MRQRAVQKNQEMQRKAVAAAAARRASQPSFLAATIDWARMLVAGYWSAFRSAGQRQRDASRQAMAAGTTYYSGCC